MILIIIGLLAVAWFAWFWRSESAMRKPWKPTPEATVFGQTPLPPPLEHYNITSYELPLRTKGRDIVDARGRRFKLSSVNWYGASDELFVPGGLDIQHRNVIAQTIKKLGFNSVRLPYADEIVYNNPKIEDRLLMANPDLFGATALDVLAAVTTSLTDNGIAVIMNNHITSATWCCGADPCDSGWANDHLGSICRVRQTEEQWIQNWETVMLPHVDNPLVIGVDLRNEVRGLWGTMPWAKWAAAAERCGNRLLKMNPDWLVVVEGTESANDVSGARTRPVKLDIEHRLVYSAHIYGWSGWGSIEGRFMKRPYESFVKTMRHNWAYLLEQDIAPVWIGEIGAGQGPSIGSHRYWDNMMTYLKSIDADFGYWAINPRKPKDNETEWYSLVEDDWVTPILDYRMKDMQELMRQ
jgi:aryl-phospho-beta-D-glucosidase BglC (GH1 family)